MHDLHASQVATGLPVLTAHVVVDDSCFYDGHLGSMLDEVQSSLSDDFDIEHSTIQFERVAHADHEHETHAWYGLVVTVVVPLAVAAAILMFERRPAAPAPAPTRA